jgi:hypothetical protein
MGIKHRADSGFRKFRVFTKLSFGRTFECFEMPYVSYPRPLCEIPANQETRHPWRAEKSRNETRRSGEAAS